MKEATVRHLTLYPKSIRSGGHWSPLRGGAWSMDCHCEAVVRYQGELTSVFFWATFWRWLQVFGGRGPWGVRGRDDTQQQIEASEKTNQFLRMHLVVSLCPVFSQGRVRGSWAGRAPYIEFGGACIHKDLLTLWYADEPLNRSRQQWHEDITLYRGAISNFSERLTQCTQMFWHLYTETTDSEFYSCVCNKVLVNDSQWDNV